MLILTRKSDESIMIGHNIEIKILKVQGNQVHIGITAPRNISVYRQEIYEQIIYSDGMIFASPIYWYSPSGIMKNFIDRLTALENMIIHEGRSRLEGKVCGVIAVGNDSGSIQLISTLLTTFVTMGFVIPPWSVAYYHAMGNVLDDEETCRDAYNVGRSVSLMAKTLKEVGNVRWYSNVRIKPLISKTSIPPDVDYQQRADKLRQIWR